MITVDRWGHNGYKELYPQDFVSDSDDDDRGSKNVDGFICSKRSHSPDLELKKKHKSNRYVSFVLCDLAKSTNVGSKYPRPGMSLVWE